MQKKILATHPPSTYQEPLGLRQIQLRLSNPRPHNLRVLCMSEADYDVFDGLIEHPEYCRSAVGYQFALQLHTAFGMGDLFRGHYASADQWESLALAGTIDPFQILYNVRSIGEILHRLRSLSIIEESPLPSDLHFSRIYVDLNDLYDIVFTYPTEPGTTVAGLSCICNAMALGNLGDILNVALPNTVGPDSELDIEVVLAEAIKNADDKKKNTIQGYTETVVREVFRGFLMNLPVIDLILNTARPFDSETRFSRQAQAYLSILSRALFPESHANGDPLSRWLEIRRLADSEEVRQQLSSRRPFAYRDIITLVIRQLSLRDTIAIFNSMEECIVFAIKFNTGLIESWNRHGLLGLVACAGLGAHFDALLALFPIQTPTCFEGSDASHPNLFELALLGGNVAIADKVIPLPVSAEHQARIDQMIAESSLSNSLTLADFAAKSGSEAMWRYLEGIVTDEQLREMLQRRDERGPTVLAHAGSTQREGVIQAVLAAYARLTV